MSQLPQNRIEEVQKKMHAAQFLGLITKTEYKSINGKFHTVQIIKSGDSVLFEFPIEQDKDVLLKKIADQRMQLELQIKALDDEVKKIKSVGKPIKPEKPIKAKTDREAENIK